MSTKGLCTSCSILEIPINEKCVHHPLLNLPFWGESNELFSRGAPVNILWSREAVRLMPIGALAMRWKVCSQGAHSSACKRFQGGRHSLHPKQRRLQRCPCLAWTSQSRPWPWDLSSWGLWWKVYQNDHYLSSSYNFWKQTSAQTSTCLEAYLLPLTLPFIPKLRPC